MATLKGMWKSTRLFLLFGAIGFGLMYVSTGFKADLVDRLGEAFVIGSIVGIGLEMAAASILISHVADELSARLVGYGLPKVAQELIYDLVHETKLVYRQYRAAYRIIENGQQDIVKLDVTLSYVVVNNGSSPRP